MYGIDRVLDTIPPVTWFMYIRCRKISYKLEASITKLTHG